MEKVSGWLLSVVGIVIIALLVDILLPVGKTSKLIKSVLAIFSVFVIISPIKQLDINNFNLSSFLGSIQIDSNFVEDRNYEKLKSLERTIEKNLEENGYSGIKIQLQGEFTQEKANISRIFVDLHNLVLKDENLNINKYTNIVAIIKKVVTIKEECIIFYEWSRT